MKCFLKRNFILIIALIVVTILAAIALCAALVDRTQVVFSNDDYLSYINGSENNKEQQLSSDIEASDVIEIPTIPLVVTSPAATDVTVSQSIFSITGTSDPQKLLTLNGQEVTRLESGEFSFDVELVPGDNIFTFQYDNESVAYTVRYSFTVIKAYAPYEKQIYEAGASFVAVALARIDSSSVTATFNGQTITLLPESYNEGEEFTNFTGTFTLPTGNETDIDLGGVTFTGVCKGLTRSYTSPSVVCLRDKALDKAQIVEIVSAQAETFDGNTTDNWSRPTNSYLPAGTVDYKVGGIVYEAKSGNSYYNLRCGKRVYISKDNPPNDEQVVVSKMYEGELPEYNNISLSSSEIANKHTVVTFDTDWRAPFSVEIGPQSYTNPAEKDYTISDVTYTYVDIKFFYTQTINVPLYFENHPLFSKAEIFQQIDGCVLRLHLNKTGAFYGWNAEYNENGQLVFSFLNPSQITEPNNLSGIEIVIDAGHGGKDVGALGLRPDVMYEAERNLSLAYKLKSELESYGATVIMTRTTDVSLPADERSELLRQYSPDLCISIHHDSSVRASANGGSFFCFNAFSDKITTSVFNHAAWNGFYSTIQKSWHYFFLARVTSCPVVLTENGYISNPQDFAGISDENTNLLKAKAIAAGVLEYFNSFYKTVANE